MLPMFHQRCSASACPHASSSLQLGPDITICQKCSNALRGVSHFTVGFGIIYIERHIDQTRNLELGKIFVLLCLTKVTPGISRETPCFGGGRNIVRGMADLILHNGTCAVCLTFVCFEVIVTPVLSSPIAVRRCPTVRTRLMFMVPVPDVSLARCTCASIVELNTPTPLSACFDERKRPVVRVFIPSSYALLALYGCK